MRCEKSRLARRKATGTLPWLSIIPGRHMRWAEQQGTTPSPSSFPVIALSAATARSPATQAVSTASGGCWSTSGGFWPLEAEHFPQRADAYVSPVQRTTDCLQDSACSRIVPMNADGVGTYRDDFSLRCLNSSVGHHLDDARHRRQ